MLQRRHQVVDDRARGRDVDRGREDVVGRLRRVDVVVGVHAATEALGGQSGDDLVGVHVARRARPGLEDVDGEVLVPVAAGDLVGGGDDGVGDVAVEHTQLGVDGRGRRLDAGKRLDVGPLERRTADREVLDRALCLGAPLGVLGNAHLAHRVVLDPEVVVGHALIPTSPPAPAGDHEGSAGLEPRRSFMITAPGRVAAYRAGHEHRDRVGVVRRVAAGRGTSRRRRRMPRGPRPLRRRPPPARRARVDGRGRGRGNGADRRGSGLSAQVACSKSTDA